MYIAKVNIETATRKYKPGERIKGQLSDADIAFLKKHNFIVSEGDFSDVPDDSEDFTDGDSNGITPPTEGLQPGNEIPGITPPVSDGDSIGNIEYKDEDALKKLNKDEIVEYAKSIGLSLDVGKLKTDLIDAVLNFVEEKESGCNAGVGGRMGFKEQLLDDLDSVFFNPEEFAETHTINGAEVDIVVDNDKLAEMYISKESHTEELFTDAIMFYVRKKDLDFEPVPGQYLEYDGRGMIISDVKTDDESYTIVLGANES